VLHALGRQEPATLAEIAERTQVASPALAYRHTRELAEMGILLEAPERTFQYADPVFRYWVTVANDPLAAEPVLLDATAARRAVQIYEEAYLREREVQGALQEGYLRDLCRNFAGQRVDGRRFGVPGRHIALPRVSDVRRVIALDAAGEVFNRPAEVELDLCFGDDVTWLGEVRRRARRASTGDLFRTAKKEALLRRLHSLRDGPTWFVSISGFEEDSRKRAREIGVYISDLADVEALRNEVATRRV
jgi:hypothetical protein